MSLASYDIFKSGNFFRQNVNDVSKDSLALEILPLEMWVSKVEVDFMVTVLLNQCLTCHLVTDQIIIL